MEHQYPDLMFGEHAQPPGGLPERSAGAFRLQNGDDLILPAHPEASGQFAEARPFGPLPGENAGDCPPVGQTGIVEEMTEKQMPLRERSLIEAFGIGISRASDDSVGKDNRLNYSAAAKGLLPVVVSTGRVRMDGTLSNGCGPVPSGLGFPGARSVFFVFEKREQLAVSLPDRMELLDALRG